MAWDISAISRPLVRYWRYAPDWFVFFAAMLLTADSGAGVRWAMPANWKADAQRPMRLATYTVTPGAECGVYYFGSGQGGSVDANLDRWIGQFQQADGKSSKAAAKIAKRTIHGLPVTTVDVSGAYTGMGGPTMQPGPAVAGYRLLGAIVEAPQGSIFFKFAGPAATIAANQAGFDKMLDSWRPRALPGDKRRREVNWAPFARPRVRPAFLQPNRR